MNTDPKSHEPVTVPHFSREGDGGRTTLGGFGEVGKHDVRLAAYGDCEEANAAVGAAMALAGGGSVELVRTLSSVQHDLFDLTSDLMSNETAGPEADAAVHISAGHIERLERAIDHFATDLRQVEGFVLPGGTAPASLIFHARTVVRRAERSVWTTIDRFPDQVSPLTARYLNRLSALLFVLARAANAEHGDTRWDAMASVSSPQDQPMEAAYT